MTTPYDAASLLKRPAEELVELDRQPLVFAFLEGRYEQIVLRDRESGEVFEVTVSDRGQLVEAGDLDASNRRAAAQRASVLEGKLSSLLLRHPELPRVWVRITRTAQASIGSQAPVEAVMSAREVAALADDPTVTRIAVLDDPVILDED